MVYGNGVEWKQGGCCTAKSQITKKKKTNLNRWKEEEETGRQGVGLLGMLQGAVQPYGQKR